MIALLVAFLLGLIPMWIMAHKHSSEADDAKRELRTVSLKNRIAAAALYGKRGDYEKSRQSASDFFSAIRSRIDNPEGVSPNEQDALRKLIADRDEVITLLARSDPAGVERLFAIEYQLRQAIPDAPAATQ